MSKVTDQVPFRVPATAKSKAGEVFDPRKDLWKFSSSSKIILIHYEPLLTWATHAFVDSLKASMSVEARRVKAGTLLITVTAGVEPLLKHAHAQNGDFVDHITLDMVQAFKLSLDDRRLYQFEWVKVLGRILINHGDPAHGMATQAAIWANSHRLP